MFIAFLFQSVSSVSSKNTAEAGPSLIDMGHPTSAGSEGFADFADFQSANATGEFNPRSQSQSMYHLSFLCFIYPNMLKYWDT